MPTAAVHQDRREKVADLAAVDPRIMCSPNAVPMMVHGCETAIARVLHAMVKAPAVAMVKKAADASVVLVAPMVRHLQVTANAVVGSAVRAVLQAMASVHAAASSFASVWIATTAGAAAKLEIAMTMRTTIAQPALVTVTAIDTTITTMTKTTRPHRPSKLSR